MAVVTRPYFIVHNGVHHMVEASQPAAAVQHVVGQAITELRPARASEVLAWSRAGKPVQIAGQKSAAAVAEAVMEEVRPDLDRQSRALMIFEDWAGYDRAAEANTKESADTVAVFSRMHPDGEMNLMTFDVLRERAPELQYAMIASVCDIPRTDDAEYRVALTDNEEERLQRVRGVLEEHPLPFPALVTAVLRHAAQDDQSIA